MDRFIGEACALALTQAPPEAGAPAPDARRWPGVLDFIAELFERLQRGFGTDRFDEERREWLEEGTLRARLIEAADDDAKDDRATPSDGPTAAGPPSDRAPSDRAPSDRAPSDKAPFYLAPPRTRARAPLGTRRRAAPPPRRPPLAHNIRIDRRLVSDALLAMRAVQRRGLGPRDPATDAWCGVCGSEYRLGPPPHRAEGPAEATLCGCCATPLIPNRAASDRFIPIEPPERATCPNCGDRLLRTTTAPHVRCPSCRCAVTPWR